MTSVLSRRQQLSGNKQWLLLVSGILFMFGCSPKITETKPPVKQVPQPTRPVEKVGKRDSVRTASIALILPLELNRLPAKITEKQISEAEPFLDFYQGFKLAIDSLAEEGNNFKIQVFDSQDNDTRVVNLALAKSVIEEHDLIVGPIFPAGIKTFSEFAKLGKKVMVSPLAATAPTQFNNPNLVTLTNSINQHGWKVADFIVKGYSVPEINVILVNTRKSEDEKFAAPIRRNINSLSKNTININEVSGSAAISDVIDQNKNNLIILTSTDRTYIVPIVDKLYKLATEQNYKIELFGHPDWIKSNALKTEKLQWLNTHLTSSYYVDGKSKGVKNFTSRYKSEYYLEPTEFSFKGFDTGYFFGKLVARYGENYPAHLRNLDYDGLSNKIKLDFNERWGYQNSGIHMLVYKGFTLQPVK